MGDGQAAPSAHCECGSCHLLSRRSRLSWLATTTTTTTSTTTTTTTTYRPASTRIVLLILWQKSLVWWYYKSTSFIEVSPPTPVRQNLWAFLCHTALHCLILLWHFKLLTVILQWFCQIFVGVSGGYRNVYHIKSPAHMAFRLGRGKVSFSLRLPFQMFNCNCYSNCNETGEMR